MKLLNKIAYVLLVSMVMIACQTGSDSVPKPRAFHRIDFPEKAYQDGAIEGPYTLQIPRYSHLEEDVSPDALPFGYDVVFEQFNARLHVSYHRFNQVDQLNALTEDARTFAFNHTVKATAIRPIPINFPDKKVFGMFYEIHGNTASQLQFYLTDSVQHYVRGALYFNERPRIDSIQPVVDFLRSDLDHMVHTFKWK
jgi:gliding motility-associated lipoprotein GldD